MKNIYKIITYFGVIVAQLNIQQVIIHNIDVVELQHTH